MESPPFLNRPDLGTRLEIFGPSRANITAGYIITALILLLSGSCGAVATGTLKSAGHKQQTPKEERQGRALCALVALTLLPIAVGVAWFTRYMSRCRVDWHENGFRNSTSSGHVIVLWPEIESITETVLSERPPILHEPLGLLLPKFTSRSYCVKTRNGKTAGFDRDSVKKLAKLAKLLRAVAERYSIPWITTEVGD